VNNKFQGYIGLEMKKFMHDLLGKPEELHYLTHLFCARVSSRLAYGSPDSAPEHVTNAGAFISQLGPSGPHTNLLPFLQYLPAWMVPGQIGVIRRQEKEDELWRALYDQTKEAHKNIGYPQTYVAASLEVKKRGEGGKPLFADETEAKFAVGMLCIVAIYTIGGPATLFALAMLLHPEWQDRVRKEIDDVIDDEMIDLKHSPLLPTLRAAIKESVRWKSTVPLGIPRTCHLLLRLTDVAHRCTTPSRKELRLRWLPLSQGKRRTCPRHCHVPRCEALPRPECI
jgi:cytochrome P450